MTPEQIQGILDYFAFLEEAFATEHSIEGLNPPSWVADEGKWQKAKDISQKSTGSIKYPFVTWLYLHRLKGGKK